METDQRLSHIPDACGVYLMRGAGESILYIGKARRLSRRVAQYFDAERRDAMDSVMAPLVCAIDYIPCASEREALLLERRLIHGSQPFFNVHWKDNKSYPYLKVTMGEDFPRLALTRRKVKDGGVYFGPYPKVTPVKGLLRALWRQKLFPLRPCRWNFSAKKPLDERKIKTCLYYHTKECPAPCAGRINAEDYRKIADKAVLFFRGDYRRLKTEFEAEMKACSSRLEYERAGVLRDNLAAIAHIGERVRVRAVREEDVSGHIEASRAVSDLQRALGLASPPLHVECFDISHFTGQGTCASMVCFQGGLPRKDHYRRFKIRELKGVDDFKAMEEVVRRRCLGLQKSGEPMPDLIVVDGGKGQLSSALKALRGLKLKVPAAALAKREEEVFLPERSQPLVLERHRPGLRLLQRLRDEAHRFAVAYNRILRKKSLLPGA